MNRSARGEVLSALSSQKDWIPRYIRTYLYDNRQHKATSLYESAAKLGLKISKKKTRTRRTNHVNKNSIQLRGEDIEDVEQFRYMGSVVSRDGGTDRYIKSRTGKATAAKDPFGRHRSSPSRPSYGCLTPM